MCGLSTRNTVTPRSTHTRTTSRERGPEALPVLGVEVDVVDVLVALRRVLGVLERAVGPAVEPLRMRLQPRVVGRALDREVDGDLDPVRLRARRRAARTRRRCRAPDRSRRARPPPTRSPTGFPGRRARVERVVAPLAVRRARSDGPAGGRRRRSRAPRTAAAACARPRSRPTSAGRARTTRRSARARGRRRRSAPATSRCRAGRPRARRAPPRRSASRGRAGRRPRRARRSTSSWPPSTFRRSSSWNDATRSVHASTRNDHMPGRSTTKSPTQWSFGCASSGSSSQRVVPGGR